VRYPHETSVLDPARDRRADHHESQNCYFVRVPDLANGQGFWVDRVLTAINPSGHHVNVFRVKTIISLDPAPTEIQIIHLDE
jgi:hypothetical protein